MVNWNIFGRGDTSFNVQTGDFSNLEIRSAGNDGRFHYFYDTSSRRLITDFVLDNRPQVETLCQVTLIKTDGSFTPRIKIWKKDKTKVGAAQQEMKIPDIPDTRTIKALVDTNECHESFWKVINFLQSFADIKLPDNNFRVLARDEAELAVALKDQDKATILGAVKTVLGSELTEQDLQTLANRKEQLDYFKQLIEDKAIFETERVRLKKRGPEALWQYFFEQNPWIFGYGLKFVSCESLDDAKLERITTGANVFTGAGKRTDGLLRSRGYISSLLFCEIKTDLTPLLEDTQYRPPDVYRVSDEVSGGVSQVQKTSHKAVRAIASEFHRLYEADGTPLRVEISTIKPMQVLVVGNLRQLMHDEDINLEKSLTFELYRKSINDVEILTFDELYERAKYIVFGTNDVG